ncbi:MAG TPA: DNA primase [Candidatus Saccharimonadia bacterium]|nr:DNA primase [Candidatus Saccharimonadia bacterium]
MDEVAEIKNRLEIVEVVGAYLPLKQAGRNLKAPCPFHAERSASFMVSPDKGIYHCFGCQEGGDIFSFVMKMEGIDFREALEKLARQAGVELKARRGEDGEAKRRRARLLEAHELAAQYFQATLVRNPKALDYVVKKRRLNKTTVKEFQIGYAPDSWNALTDFLTKRGFTAAELLEGGLAGQKEGRSTIYDFFRGRIMFTICDREGRPIGFTARVLDDSLPKYMNTPQTPLYDKSQVIFGLHLAKEAIRAGNEVVLVEGQMDVVASHQAGVKQVVATSGTALTLEHLRALAKLTKTIKLAFDADRAGLAATERAIELGQKLGLTLRMVEIPGAKDADELIAQDPAAWTQAIAEAKYIVDYLFDRFAHDYDLNSAVGKRQYADRLAATLRRLGDPVEQDHYVKLLAERVGTSEEAVRAKLAQTDEESRQRSGSGPAGVASTRRDERGGAMPTGASIETTPHARRSNTSGPSSAAQLAGSPRAKVQATRPGARLQLERLVLALALTYPLTRLSLDDLHERDFSTPEHQAVYRALKANRDESGVALAASLTDLAKDINILLLVGERQFAELAPADRSIEAFELVRRLQTASNKELKHNLIGQLREADMKGDAELVHSLTLQIQAINNEEV